MTNAKNVLMLWGGMDFHEPEQTTTRFARLLTDLGHQVEVTSDPGILDDADRLHAADLIVITMTMGEITDQQDRNLLNAVREGTGLGGWHGGLCDAFRTRSEYQFATGGQWVSHPGDMIDYTVNVVPGHPITEGVRDFPMHSEQYYLHVDPGVNVLAWTTFSGVGAPWVAGVRMPSAWTKVYGEGKVFYQAMGHVDPEFEEPNLQRLTVQGLIWAMR